MHDKSIEISRQNDTQTLQTDAIPMSLNEIHESYPLHEKTFLQSNVTVFFGQKGKREDNEAFAAVLIQNSAQSDRQRNTIH